MIAYEHVEMVETPNVFILANKYIYFLLSSAAMQEMSRQHGFYWIMQVANHS